MRDDWTTIIQGLQNEILEAIARGVPCHAALDLLCRRVEMLAPSAICSILCVDEARRLQHLAGPSLPESYREALDGLEIGPSVGSCGTAAFLGVPVEVQDIATDPLWAPFAHLALPLGLLACWSSPIRAADGRVVATFAFYYPTKRGPTDIERLVVAGCVHLCAIAIQSEEIQQRNHRLAYYDPLTGLPNRRSFDRLVQGLSLAPSPAFGLMLVDIDRLKEVNDTMGLSVGDELVREVAERLRGAIRGAYVSRLDGDEFAVLVEGCHDHGALRNAADQILATAGRPLCTAGITISPGVTVGGAVFGIDGDNPEELRQNAAIALHHAKETRRSGYLPFRRELRQRAAARQATVISVQQALAEDRIVVHYQPIVHLKSGRPIGLEALLRLRTPDGRILAAGEFQIVFQQPDLARRLTGRLITGVAADIRRWLDERIDFRHVGINLAAADFLDGELDLRIADMFGAAGVPLRHIIVEITELVFMDGPDGHVARAVENLRQGGMRVALDDFGTGFASLTHLLTLPVDIMKIDRSFTARLLTDPQGEVIVKALIEIARKLDLRVVAEGVETAAQVRRLIELGCELGQGFHFGGAVNAEMATALLADPAPWDGTEAMAPPKAAAQS